MPQTATDLARTAKLKRFNPRVHELKQPSGVGFGGTSYLTITPGPTYQNLMIQSNCISAINRISITRNGSEIIDVTPRDLRDLEQEVKNYSEEDRLVIPFADFSLKTLTGIRETELVTNAGVEFMLNVEWGSKPADFDGDIPSLKVRAYTTDNQPIEYWRPRIIRTTWDHPSAGEIIHEYLGRSANRYIKRLFFRCDAADIEKIEILRDNSVITKMKAEDYAYDLAVCGLETPENVFVVDFTQFGFGADGKFDTEAAESLQFRITKKTAGHIQILQQITEMIRTPDVA